MRPCNQCRQTVENGVFICSQCEDYNAKHNLEPPQPVKANPADDLEGGPNRIADSSVAQVVSAFYAVTGLLGALVGLVLFGTFQSFLIGGLIGLVGCVIFLRIVFAGT